MKHTHKLLIQKDMFSERKILGCCALQTQIGYADNVIKKQKTFWLHVM